MSLLLTAVAVRHDSADDVVDVVLGLLRETGRRVEVLPTDAEQLADSHYDVCVGAQADGWVTVHPHYLVPADGLAIALTSRLGTVSSAASIYEDVFWTHDLVSHGRVLDRYVNLPGTDLWRRLGIAWGGNDPVARLPVGDEGNVALSEHVRAMGSS